MRKSSIHIEKGNLGYCFHNTRQKPTANSIFSTEKNEYDNDAIKAIEIYRTELKKREKAYTKRTGKKLNKNTITHLSAIVNLDERHTLEDVKKVAKYLEDTLGTKVFQIAIHQDEGYVDDETNEQHINYHAHIEMLGLDEQGNSVRRKLTRSYLINLQSKVAEMLNMQRGINYTKEKKKRPKRLDTYEYKEHAKRKDKALKPVLKENKQLKEENEELKLTKKELEKEISELRKKMIDFNKQLEKKEFTQEDYKYLSALKKGLKANNLKEIYIKLKEFDKSVSDRMLKFKEYTKKLEEENKKLKEKLTQSKNIMQKLLEENKRLKEEIEKLKELYVQSYRAEIICIACERAKPFNPGIIMQLKEKNLIEDYKIDNKSGIKIKTKEFKLEETKKQDGTGTEGFEIKKEKGLTEEEIEKAILIILQVKGWGIENIAPSGNDDFVRKANKVIEKLKKEQKLFKFDFKNNNFNTGFKFKR